MTWAHTIDVLGRRDLPHARTTTPGLGSESQVLTDAAVKDDNADVVAAGVRCGQGMTAMLLRRRTTLPPPTVLPGKEGHDEPTSMVWDPSKVDPLLA